MPYQIGSPPDKIKDLPDKAQEIWIKAYNSAWETYDGDEAKCSMVAWSAVKKNYKQNPKGGWVKMKDAKLETVDIDSVEILAVGKWDGVPMSSKYNEKDLDNIVKSFNTLTGDKELNYEPPVKLGHAGKQKLLQEDGYPSAGWITSLKRVGNKLVASFGSVPKKIGDIIKAGGYKKVSSEIYFNYEIQSSKYPLVLKAVSLLGGDIPAVKTLDDIVAQYGEVLLDEDGREYLTTEYELGEPRGGVPKTDIERVMAHYGIDREAAEKKIEEKGIDKLLPPRGTKIKEEEVTLDEIINDLDTWLTKAEGKIKNKVGSPAIRTYLREVKTKLKALVSKNNLAEDEAISDKVNRIRDAFYDLSREGLPPIPEGGYGWVTEVYEDFVIVEKGGNYFKLPYSEKEDGIVFDTAKMQEVKRVYEVVKQSEAGKSSDNNKLNEKEELMENELRELLGLADDADVLEAVKALKATADSKAELTESVTLAEHDKVKGQVAVLETTLAEQARDKRVADAITKGKLTPAQKEWADKYALTDPSGFDAFIDAQPVVVALGEVGVDGADNAVEVTEAEAKLAEKMGVSKEDLIAAKKEEK